MPKLILIRHGESQWNLENRFTGWVDVPLTEKGRDEARRAGAAIRDISIRKAYTSVLDRAIETLILALDGAGRKDIEIVKDPALNERHYGDLQGLNKAETAKKFGDAQVKIWRRSYDVAPPNGESLKDTAARTLPYFRNVIMKDIAAGENIVISAHGNSLRAIVMELDHLTREQVLELNIPNGVPIVYDLAPSGDVVSKISLMI